MLDIINGKVVAKTEEGCFEISARDAHRAITVHLLEIMEDNTPDCIRENYKKAQKLYLIGNMIYKDPSISEKNVRDDLIPLMDCLVQDIADRHIAYLIMRYVTREYAYRIKVIHEVESLYDFFYILRDPIYTTILRNDLDYELFYRIDTAFYDEIGEPSAPLNNIQNGPVKEDYIYIQKDNIAFRDAIDNNKELPNIDPERKYGKIVQDTIRIPNSVALWALDLKRNNLITDEDYAELKEYMRLVHAIYSPITDSSKYWVDKECQFESKKGAHLLRSYKEAAAIGCYNLCYYIALRIGSDVMRKRIARLSGIQTKIYSDHNSLRRFIKTIAKTALIAIALYAGYRIIKAIYDFISMPIIFWMIAIPFIGMLLSTSESREAVTLFTTTSFYRRTRLEQAMRHEKQLKELNDNLRMYNTTLNRSNNGFRYF